MAGKDAPRALRWRAVCARSRSIGAPLSLALAAALLAVPLAAQAPRPQPQAKAAAPKEAPGDSGLKARVEQLEAQLVDLQVTVGTLESLAKGATAPVGARPSAAAALDASEAGRLDGLETQIRALAAQLEQLQEQVRALTAHASAPAFGQGLNATPGEARVAHAERSPSEGERASFSSVTVSPGSERDEIRQLLSKSADPGPANQGATALSQPHQANAGPQSALIGSDAEGPPGNSKQLYETAYGYLLQRDYGAAETAFEEFLRRYPNDPLAGNAQYWLGESLYVRGQYRAAANAFLKGYQGYSKSSKAPDSLLKLAMSLQRLGQKEAACSSFGELTTKFPNAAQHIKTTAQAERQRAGCS
jgi:tol-pal system protein YbgF